MFVLFVFLRSAPLILAFDRLTFVRFAPFRLAFWSFALHISQPSKLMLERLNSLSCILASLVSLRLIRMLGFS